MHFAGYLARRQFGKANRTRLLTLRLKDMTITFNEGDSQLTGYYEIVVDRIYDRAAAVIARPGWTVVDVGASIGIFSICQARRGAEVIAYEPHPRAFANMLTNLKANGVDSQVTCVNAAVSNAPGAGWLSAASGSSNAHLTSEVSRRDFAVALLTLDDSLAKHGVKSVDLLKIDVEGAELDVLSGAQATLKRTGAVVIEVHGLSAEVVDSHMERYGLRRDAFSTYPNLYYVRAS